MVRGGPGSYRLRMNDSEIEAEIHTLRDGGLLMQASIFPLKNSEISFYMFCFCLCCLFLFQLLEPLISGLAIITVFLSSFLALHNA